MEEAFNLDIDTSLLRTKTIGQSKFYDTVTGLSSPEKEDEMKPEDEYFEDGKYT